MRNKSEVNIKANLVTLGIKSKLIQINLILEKNHKNS